MTVGKNIKQVRLLKGFTQEALAGAIDKSVNFVSLIERGESGLSIPTIVDICNSLDIDTNSIFTGLTNSNDITVDGYITRSLDMFEDSDKSIVTNLIKYIIDNKH
ncbi:MAG: helix-turn-helix transcriptional regulator [Clostridia bacterium]